MEAQHVIEELGEPVISFISNHEVIEVDHKNVSVRFRGRDSRLYMLMCFLMTPTPASVVNDARRIKYAVVYYRDDLEQGSDEDD